MSQSIAAAGIRGPTGLRRALLLGAAAVLLATGPPGARAQGLPGMPATES